MKDSFNESESKIINHRKYKKYITIKVFLCLVACIAVIVVSMMHYIVKSNEYDPTFPFKYGTFPGVGNINPSVMYNGAIYYWKEMAGPVDKLPQGELPEGYKYVDNIKYVDTGKLTKDFQFIATFNATGKLYYNSNEPNKICICITTSWLDNAYVIFSTH